jgi:hypothetical protein
MTTIKSLTVAIVFMLGCATSVLARTFYFRGTLTNGHKVIGGYDANHLGTCVKINNDFLSGYIKANQAGEIPDFKRVQFTSERIYRQGRVNKLKKTFIFKIDDASSIYPVLTDAETHALYNGKIYDFCKNAY